MVSEELLVILRASTAQFEEKFASAEAQVQGFSTRSTGGLQKFAALGGASLLVAGAAAAAIGVVSVKAADDYEKSHARLENAVKRAGLSFDEERGTIDESNAAMERLGITNSESENSLSRLVTATGSVAKAQKDQAIAADIAAARGISLQSATDILVKVESGRYTQLGRLGIATKDQIAGFKDSAEAVDFLSGKYQGSAARAAETFGGKIKVLSATLEDIGVQIGLVLIPIIEDLASGLSDTIHWFEDNEAVAIALGVAVASVLVPAMVYFIGLKVVAFASAVSRGFTLMLDGVAALVGPLLGTTAAFEALTIAEGEEAVAADAAATATAAGWVAALGPIALVVGAILGGAYALGLFDDEQTKIQANSGKWAAGVVSASEKATGGVEQARTKLHDLGSELERATARERAMQESLAGGGWQKYGLTFADVQQKVKDLATHIDNLKSRHDALKGAIAEVEAKTRAEGAAHVDASGKITGHIQTVKELEAALKAAAAAQDLENNATIASFSSEIQAQTSLKSLTDDVNAHKDSLTLQSDALSAAGAQAKTWGDNIEAQTGKQLTAKEKTDLFKLALQGLEGQFPGLTPILQGYIDRLNAIPANRDTHVTVQTDSSSLDSIAGKLSNVIYLEAIAASHKISFRRGGAVPGSENQAVDATLHGGEYVLSADVVNRIKRGGPSDGAAGASIGPPSDGGGGGGDTYILSPIINVTTFDKRGVSEVVWQGFKDGVRTNGPGAVKKLLAGAL